MYRIVKRSPYDIKISNYFSVYFINLTKDIDATNNLFYTRQVNSCKGDSSQQWRVMNMLTGINVNKSIDRLIDR